MRLLLFLAFCLCCVQLSLAKTVIPVRTADVNYLVVWLCFFFCVLLTALFRYLNMNSALPDQRSNAGQPLSIGMIFLGITILISFVLLVCKFWKGHYFYNSSWNVKQESGGLVLRILFLTEMLVTLFAIAASGYLMYWFYGKRDIFPKMFITFLTAFLVFKGSLLTIYHFISTPYITSSMKKDMLNHFLWAVLYAALCVSFILKSPRVKQTFIYPAEK